MSLQVFIKYFIYAYGIVFSHVVFMILFMSKKRTFHFISGIFLADFSIMCVLGGMCIRSPRVGIPLTIGVFLTMTFIAPLGTLLVFSSLNIRERGRFLLLFVTAGTVCVLVSGMIFIHAGLAWRPVFSMVYGWLFITFSLVAVFLHMHLRPIKTMPPGVRVYYALVCLDVVLVGGMCLFQILDFYKGLYILWMLIILSIMGMVFIAYRFPETYRLVEVRVAKTRYERSRLNGVDIQKTFHLIESLMKNEKLFQNGDLTLSEVGNRVGITPSQVSEFINQNMGKSFSAYVNGFRIDHAKKKLIETDHSIIRIAFDSGFNSKSAFNREFRNITGKSPTEYRSDFTGV